MDTCKNCYEPVNGNYCSNCGQPAKLRRIDIHYVLSEIGDFFLANKGMIYTIKKILINPGESVRRFISEDRYRFVKPITFLLITSLLFTLVNHIFKIDYLTQYNNTSQTQMRTMSQISRWILENRGYAAIIIGLLMAFWLKLFFRKSGYNLFEIFILLCFVSGITSVWMSVVSFFQGILHLNLLMGSILVSLIYHFWAIGQFFDGKKAVSYIKAILSWVVGVMAICIILSIVAVIEFIVRY